MRVVRQHKYFSAIGVGVEYALGAIKAVYDLIDDPEEIAKISIEASAQFDLNTELPIQIQCINLECRNKLSRMVSGTTIALSPLNGPAVLVEKDL